MYLGTIYQISARPDFKFGGKAAILENQQHSITPELMTGSSSNFIVGMSN
jgi:hypothetical protein